MCLVFLIFIVGSLWGAIFVTKHTLNNLLGKFARKNQAACTHAHTYYTHAQTCKLACASLNDAYTHAHAPMHASTRTHAHTRNAHTRHTATFNTETFTVLQTKRFLSKARCLYYSNRLELNRRRTTVEEQKKARLQHQDEERLQHQDEERLQHQDEERLQHQDEERLLLFLVAVSKPSILQQRHFP
jgi:hypothetical protein